MNLGLELGVHPIVIMHGAVRGFDRDEVEALWNQREKVKSFGYRRRREGLSLQLRARSMRMPTGSLRWIGLFGDLRSRIGGHWVPRSLGGP